MDLQDRYQWQNGYQEYLLTNIMLGVMMLVRFDALKYSVKVWLTSAAVGPVVFYLAANLFHYYDEEIFGPDNDIIHFLFGSYIFIVIIGIILSCLTWLLFYLLTRMVVTGMFPKLKYVKSVIASSGALLTFANFSILPAPLFSTALLGIIGSYTLCIVLSSFIYDLNIEIEPKPEV